MAAPPAYPENINQPFAQFDDRVLAVAISPNGRRIAVGLNNGNIEIWDLLIRDRWAICKGHTNAIYCVAFSPDGKTIVSGSYDKTVRLWDLEGNAIAPPFEGHTNYVRSVAFGPDGDIIASAGYDATIRLWDLEGNAIALPLQGHTGSVFAVAFSPDGQTIASGGNDATVRLWDLEGNAIGQPFEGHTNTVFSVAFSPNGSKLISGSGDNTVRLWDLTEEPAFFSPIEGHTEAIYSVAFSPDSRYIVSAGYDRTARVWDLYEGSLSILVFSDHTDSIRSAVFSPDGEFIVSGSQDGTVRLWDLQGNPIDPPFSGHTDIVTSIAFSPNGNILVSGSSDRKLRLWNINGNPLYGSFSDHEGSVTSVAFSPYGDIIVSGSNDGTVVLWDLQGQSITTFIDAGYVYSVAFSPDGNIIVSGSHDRKVRLWDLQGNPITDNLSTHEDMVTSVAFSPDGQTIVSGSVDETLRLWDLQGNPIGQPFSGHQGTVNSVAFSPDGQTIVSGSYDKTVRLWDLQGNPIGQPFSGHEAFIRSVAFSPDGKTVVSGSNDGKVLLWDLSDPQHQRHITIAENIGAVFSVAFDPKGDYIFSAGEDGIQAWHWLKFDSYLDENYLNILRTAQAFRNDQPTGEDTLNVTKELYALADVLMLRSLQPPLAVAILGSWGSGKSFAMHLIRQQITKIRCQSLTPEQAWPENNNPNDPNLSPFVGHIYQINFDAWSYAKSDLWASLMQTIFDELNRQLTLEKQLSEISPLLQGGKIWQILNGMNESERKAFLESELSTEVLEEWKEKSADVNALWDILSKLRKEEQEKLESTEKSLQNLQQQKEQLELEVQQQTKQIEQKINQENDQEALAKAVLLQLKLLGDKEETSIFKDLFQDLGIEFPDLSYFANIEDEKIIHLIQSKDTKVKSLIHNADKIKNILNHPIQISRLIEIVQKDKIKFLSLLFLAILPFLVYGLLNYLPLLLASTANISQFWLQLISNIVSTIKIAATLLATLPVVQQGLKIFRKLNILQIRINQIVQVFKQNYQQEYQKLELEKDKKINQKIEELHQHQQTKDKISEINNEIEKLETQARIQRQRVGLTAQYPSLLDFVNNRLEENSYKRLLGVMHQIKQDLEDLTNHLAYNSASQSPDKLAALKKYFPRGPARIVLYIDDLDRCPPEKVVQVLEAVQLLLKTELFIVVLAIDDRYINRALETIYRGVLKRGGSPSGTDYIEKIIQIPYRMRPIADAADIDRYLKSLIDIEEEKINLDKQEELLTPKIEKPALPKPQPQKLEITQNPEITNTEPANFGSQLDNTREIITDAEPENFEPQLDNTREIITDAEPEPEIPPSPPKPLLLIDKFTPTEFEIIKECCQHVDITPRTAKRLINICKILKIIWTPTPNDIRWKTEPNIDAKKTLIAFLALAGRYPTQMRKVLAEVYLEFEQKDKQIIKLDHAEVYLEFEQNEQEIVNLYKEPFLAYLQKQDSFMDLYNQREWKKFKHDFQKMPPQDKFVFERRTFNLAMSFCFVGDVGYDPDDSYNYSRFDDSKKMYGFQIGK